MFRNLEIHYILGERIFAGRKQLVPIQMAAKALLDSLLHLARG